MTDSGHDGRPTLVLGGTGKTGRRIAERLRTRDVPVRIASQSASPAFDWDERDTWPAVLEGVGAVYVSYAPDLAVPGAPDAVGAFAKLAAQVGVGRLVLLSGRGEEEALRSEQAVRDAFGEPTIARSSWFAQNFSESFLLESVLAGEVGLPRGLADEPFIDAEDIADVAVAALVDQGHAGRLYEVTGPRLLSFADAVAEISATIDRPVRYIEVSMEQFAASLQAQHLPADYAWLLDYLFTEVLDGRNAHLADGVQQALGRPARDFHDYVAATAATGVWNGR